MTTINEIWEEFLAADDTLKLKIPTKEGATAIKQQLSTYKTRVLAADPELSELLGPFRLNFDIYPLGTKWILEIGQNRTGRKADVEILRNED